MTETDPYLLDPDQAPTPFSAAEIREGCPRGRTTRLLVEQPGAPDQIRLSRFVDCDASGAVIESSVLGPGGEELESPSRRRVAWTELQAHASFPADITTIETELIELPVGPLQCLRYTVDSGDTVTRFWFAKDFPGMPVYFTSERDGLVESRTTMIANEFAEV